MKASHSEQKGNGFRMSPAAWCASGLVLLLAVNLFFNSHFLGVSLVEGHFFGAPIDILNQGSRAMLLALGMTLVIATGGIDLSVGSVVAISGALCAVLLSHDVAIFWVVLAAVAVGATAGAANGTLVAGFGIQPIVATLILMVAGRGVAQLITNGQVLLIKQAGFGYLANGYVTVLPFAPLLVFSLYGVARLVLRSTAMGLFVEAVGDNEKASHFAGLPAAKIKACAYIFSGACAGLTGVLVASQIRAADSYRAGENFELDAIFAVVVGGTALGGGRFYLMGSLVGALLLQTLTTSMYNMGVPPAIAPVPKAVLIIGVALIQSERLRTTLGRRFGRSKRAIA